MKSWIQKNPRGRKADTYVRWHKKEGAVFPKISRMNKRSPNLEFLIKRPQQLMSLTDSPAFMKSVTALSITTSQVLERLSNVEYSLKSSMVLLYSYLESSLTVDVLDWQSSIYKISDCVINYNIASPLKAFQCRVFIEKFDCSPLQLPGIVFNSWCPWLIVQYL